MKSNLAIEFPTKMMSVSLLSQSLGPSPLPFSSPTLFGPKTQKDFLELIVAYPFYRFSNGCNISYVLICQISFSVFLLPGDVLIGEGSRVLHSKWNPPLWRLWPWCFMYTVGENREGHPKAPLDYTSIIFLIEVLSFLPPQKVASVPKPVFGRIYMVGVLRKDKRLHNPIITFWAVR